MRTWPCLASLMTFAVLSAVGQSADTPEPALPRPGAVLASQVIGDVDVVAGGQTKPLKADERVRVGATVTTGRKSFVVLELSNGAVIQLGAETELELEEFGQQPFPSSIKPKEEKNEPSISRTRLRLARGDLVVTMKPLNRPRGSSFAIALPAGTARIAEGRLRTMTRTTDLGIGLCTLELENGTAEFEPLGAAAARVPVGRKVAYAFETDRVSGTVKVSEMPRELAKPAK